MNNMEKSRGNLLLEFFSEEIPARMQLNSEIQLQNLFVKSLTERDIAFESFKTFSGPRHLAIIIKSIELEQKDQEIEKRGPRICLLYTSPSPRDKRQSRMPSSA